MPELIASLTTGLTGIQTNLLSAFAVIVPVALGVVGAVMVVKFGVKTFKSLVG